MNLGLLAARAGRGAEALDLLAAGRTAALDGAGVLIPMARRVAGEASLALGALEVARDELELALSSARDDGSRLEEALTLLARSRLLDGRGDGGAEVLQAQARPLLDRLGVIRVDEEPSS